MSELSFLDLVHWDERGARIPKLTDAQIEEVLLAYRPTPANPICACQASTVCPACLLTQVIDQLRKPNGEAQVRDDDRA